MKLLIVDDDSGICLMLSRVFRVEGYSVQVASTGAEALEVLNREPIDLVLLDYHLADMDATAILGEARERGWEVPMIVMSGLGDHEVGGPALEYGAVEVIDKPFDLDLVRKMVKENVGPG